MDFLCEASVMADSFISRHTQHTGLSYIGNHHHHQHHRQSSRLVLQVEDVRLSALEMGSIQEAIPLLQLLRYFGCLFAQTLFITLLNKVI
jgi:hypothetical protein